MTTRNTRIRFCANNLAASTAAVVTSASAAAGFPLTNLANNLRFKTWKPNGNFTVTTSNQLIYISDGSNRTITLTPANYSGGAALATHIATQLNASSSNWTCTYSSTTFKFTIGRSSGTALLRFTQTSTAAWDMLGYTGVADTATSTGLAADEARNHTSEYVDVDLGVASNVTFFSLLGPLGSVFSISSTATIRLYGNTSSSMTSPALTVTLTSDLNGIYQFLDDQTSSTYRYWRFEYIDRRNTSGPTSFQFGYLYLGDYTTITHRNVASGFTKTVVDPAIEQQSEAGALFYQTGLKHLEFDQVQIAYMDATDRRTLETLFYSLGRSVPFFVSFDPTLSVTTALSELTSYVVFKEDPSFNHIRADIYSVNMSFKEVM